MAETNKSTPAKKPAAKAAPKTTAQASPQTSAAKTASAKSVATKKPAPKQTATPAVVQATTVETTTAVVYGSTPAPSMNIFALLSFIFAFFISIPAIIFGHIALKQISRTNESGRGFALAGLIIGYAHFALLALFLVFYFVFFGAVVLFGLLSSAGR